MATNFYNLCNLTNVFINKRHNLNFNEQLTKGKEISIELNDMEFHSIKTIER